MASRGKQGRASGDMTDPRCIGGGFCDVCWEHWLFYGPRVLPKKCPRCGGSLGDSAYLMPDALSRLTHAR